MPGPAAAVARRSESRRGALAGSALLAASIHACVLLTVELPAREPRPRRETVELTLVAPASPAAQAELPPPEPPAPSVPPRRVTRPAAARPAAAPLAPSRAEARAPARSETPEEPPGAAAPAPSPAPPAISEPSARGGGGPASGPRVARPKYKSRPEPAYPALARRRRQQGVVLLTVLVGASGRPDSVEIRSSSGFRALDDAALEAVKQWEFEPARLGGVPVASEVEVPIRFQLDVE